MKKRTKAPRENGGEKSVLVGFMVNDLDSIVKILRERSVKFFKSPTEESFGKHTIVEDPDGTSDFNSRNKIQTI